MANKPLRVLDSFNHAGSMFGKNFWGYFIMSNVVSILLYLVASLGLGIISFLAQIVVYVFYCYFLLKFTAEAVDEGSVNLRDVFSETKERFFTFFGFGICIAALSFGMELVLSEGMKIVLIFFVKMEWFGIIDRWLSENYIENYYSVISLAIIISFLLVPVLNFIRGKSLFYGIGNIGLNFIKIFFMNLVFVILCIGLNRIYVNINNDRGAYSLFYMIYTCLIFPYYTLFMYILYRVAISKK